MLELKFLPKRKLSGAAIEAACERLGLSCTMKGSLKSLPENIHWHFKNGKQKGVLEITFMHHTGQIILSVHDNRMGVWEREMMKLLKERFE